MNLKLSSLVITLREKGWIPTEETINIQQEVYGLVVARDLTPLELEEDRHLSPYLYSVSVEFKSSAGKKYQAIHFPREFCILLYSASNLSELGWDNVEQTIDAIVNGHRQNLPYLKSSPPRTKSTINRTLHLQEKPTLEKIADYVDAYKEHFGKFGEVLIKGAIFTNVPRFAYQHSSLREKLQIIE